eukprot:gb/GECG01011326.1/.p1 GENE.gb/GECG01011326.1/~~gb/GECG01011326.1/.p1  ORF type:complete len:167 (+),score=20.02 gb/GECG01011326.1/:1-501(+)
MGDERAPRVDRDKLFSIRVANLPYSIRKEELEDHFAKYGQVGDVYVPTDRDTGSGRGFAFVRYEEKSAADEAVAQEDNVENFGRTLHVGIAEPPRPRGDRDFGGRGGGRGGFRGGRGGGGRFGDRDRRDGYGGDRGDRRGGDRREERRPRRSRSRSREERRRRSRS